MKKAASLRFGDHLTDNGNNSSGNNPAATNFPVLECDKPEEMFEKLFALSTYTFPDTIKMPSDYVPPSMAIATAYWKVS